MNFKLNTYFDGVYKKIAKHTAMRFNMIKNKKNILISDIEYLSFNVVNEIVSSNNPSNIFCEIEYEFENKKYNLIKQLFF